MSKDLTQALRDLMGDEAGPAGLPKPTSRGAAPARTSSALLGGANAGKAGIASPLTEDAVNGRSLYPTERYLITTDGLIWAKYQPYKTLRFSDANGSPAVFELLEPT